MYDLEIIFSTNAKVKAQGIKYTLSFLFEMKETNYMKSIEKTK